MKQTPDNLRLALASHPLVQIATVFGSFGSPRENPQSDVDIAIASTQPLTLDQRLELLNLIERTTGRRVDLIDLFTATGTVFKEAMTTGRILVNHNRDLMGRILIRLLSEEEDFQKRKRALAAEARERIFRVQGSSQPKT